MNEESLVLKIYKKRGKLIPFSLSILSLHLFSLYTCDGER